jgi:phosphoribosylanthranilate isomerase
LSLSNDIEKVGVFVNPTFEYIKEAIKKSKITMVQLHGSESPMFCKKVERIIPVIKAVRVRDNENLSVLKPYKKFTLLLDAYSDKTMGGSGKKINWQFAKKAVKKGYKIILSGGLKPVNISKAIKYVKPFGVDVSSGVEKTPGIKDTNKIKNFLTLTRTTLT